MSGTGQGPPGAQRSFARSRCYLSRSGVSRHLRGHYPSFVAHTTSCARPKPSHRLRLLPWSAGLCRLLPAPAGRRPFPTLSPRVFPWMLGPLSRRCAGCTYPFLPPHRRPSPSYHRSALPQIPTLATSEWKDISQLQPFHYVRASKFACHPGRSHLCEFHPQGGRGVYVRAEHTSLPPYASDMLALRTGQLRARGLPPRKTRGLVGRCDDPHAVVHRKPGVEPRLRQLGPLLDEHIPTSCTWRTGRRSIPPAAWRDLRACPETH